MDCDADFGDCDDVEECPDVSRTGAVHSAHEVLGGCSGHSHRENNLDDVLFFGILLLFLIVQTGI